MKKKDKIFLLGSVKTNTPDLEELKKPLSKGKVAKVFCINCGKIVEINNYGIFMLLSVSKKGDIDLYLKNEIDWTKKYIVSNYCNYCPESSMRSYWAKIKEIPE